MQNFGFYQSATPQFKGRLRRSYEKLTPEQRIEVAERYDRHLRACRIADCEPEIMFLFEAIEELAAGRPLEAEEVRKR
jgi:hypothetical protein